MSQQTEGKVTQIIGPVVDFKFQRGSLPAIGNAVEVNYEGRKIIFETKIFIFLSSSCSFLVLIGTQKSKLLKILMIECSS